MLIYILKEGTSTVGRKGDDSHYDIKLTGALVAEKHCTFVHEQSTVTLNPFHDAPTYVNGNLITKSLVLHHGDRIIIGGDHFFRFNHPVEVVLENIFIMLFVLIYILTFLIFHT